MESVGQTGEKRKIRLEMATGGEETEGRGRRLRNSNWAVAAWGVDSSEVGAKADTRRTKGRLLGVGRGRKYAVKTNYGGNR